MDINCQPAVKGLKLIPIINQQPNVLMIDIKQIHLCLMSDGNIFFMYKQKMTKSIKKVSKFYWFTFLISLNTKKTHSYSIHL